MIYDNNIVLLLTGCVRPNNMPNTALLDMHKRLKQYLSAIRFYLKSTNYRIVFVENSNTDISQYVSREVTKRCEFITFDGNSFNHNLGKGYGEGLIIKRAFDVSKFLKESIYIIKISGRYIISNFNAMIAKTLNTKSFKDNHILCNINPYKRGGQSMRLPFYLVLPVLFTQSILYQS